jgi:hypothetical protein
MNATDPQEKEMLERIEMINVARGAILEDLKRRYFANDKAVKPQDPDTKHRWHEPQPNCFTGAGVMDCPVCKTGKLKYHRSAYNGHVHALCSTPGCVSWME